MKKLLLCLALLPMASLAMPSSEYKVDRGEQSCESSKEDIKQDWKQCVVDGDWHLSYPRGGSYEAACKKFAIKLNCEKVEK